MVNCDGNMIIANVCTFIRFTCAVILTYISSNYIILRKILQFHKEIIEVDLKLFLIILVKILKVAVVYILFNNLVRDIENCIRYLKLDEILKIKIFITFCKLRRYLYSKFYSRQKLLNVTEINNIPVVQNYSCFSCFVIQGNISY